MSVILMASGDSQVCDPLVMRFVGCGPVGAGRSHSAEPQMDTASRPLSGAGAHPASRRPLKRGRSPARRW